MSFPRGGGGERGGNVFIEAAHYVHKHLPYHDQAVRNTWILGIYPVSVFNVFPQGYEVWVSGERSGIVDVDTAKKKKKEVGAGGIVEVDTAQNMYISIYRIVTRCSEFIGIYRNISTKCIYSIAIPEGWGWASGGGER